MVPIRPQGDVIHPGQSLGVVKDFFGHEREVVISDENAVVLGVMTVLARGEGDMLMGLGTLD